MHNSNFRRNSTIRYTIIFLWFFVNGDNYCVQANIGRHKFIAFSNNDNQIETVLFNDLKTTTLKHTVIFTVYTTNTATITHEWRASKPEAYSLKAEYSRCFLRSQLSP
ncbi:hypothetical protein T01_4476 [Trichinella spiralis]|uniref:Uncharacterized protein n=1 Tax=Trichinella spiralis TaxID=6334 RepID=A0A0V1BTR5_TRISP|nr:hypothetical protein T01_4476 [Trichinella spiralis]